MKIKNANKLSKQHFQLVKCIFQGMTIPQIAKNMCCSQSCVSYHLNQLYSKYSAKSRSEFILSIFGEIIDNYKLTILSKDSNETKLNNEVHSLKKILIALISNKNDAKLFEYWSIEAQKHL